MLILIGYLLPQQKRKSSRLNGFFLLVCIFNLLMLLGDMPNWLYNGHDTAWASFALRAGTTLYFAASAPLLLFFTGYVMEFPKKKPKCARSLWRASAVLAAAQVAGSVLSLFNGMFFAITEQNIYQRGSLFLLSQAIPFVLYAINGWIIFASRKQLRRKEVFFLLSYVVLPILAEAVQILHYGVALVNAGAAIAILLIFVNIQWERELLMKKREAELTQARIDIMLSQIQPHFLYNSLTVISHLCTADPALAKQTTQEFSRFLRANIDALSDSKPIPFEKELEHVRNYLSLEQKRFGERLQVVYDIQANDFILPSLSLQPLAENAVRHGIIRREDGGTVTITSKELDTAYLIVVADDGVGFDSTKPLDDSRSHIGLQNVRSRLQFMCEGTLQVESTPGTGTVVTVTLPKAGEKA